MEGGTAREQPHTKQPKPLFRIMAPMSTDRPFFATPQDAEAAFYDALERADLDAMMAVWSEDEEIVCIHPGGPRLAGYAAVRESWRMIFRNGSRLRVTTSGLQATHGMLLAVHNLHEQLSLVGEDEAHQTVLATNVYQRGADGWRMVLHHTAPAPDAPDAAADPLPDVPATLH